VLEPKARGCTIEDSFETAKNEFGLDHNETRSWHGWHRHVSLVMLAFAMMAAIRHPPNRQIPKKTKQLSAKNLRPSSAGQSRKSAG
jgi:SRSO17 transposase